MKNQFEINLEQENSEGVVYSPEDLAFKFEDQLSKDLATLKLLDDQFINETLEEFGVIENDPDNNLKKEIDKVSRYYSEQMDLLKNEYFKGLREITKKGFNFLKNTTIVVANAVIVFGAVAHYTRKEYPDLLSKDRPLKEVTWDSSTKDEIEKLSNEYAIWMNEKYKDADIDSTSKNRFLNFVKEFAPDIQILDPDDKMGISQQLNEWVFRGVFNQPKSRAHYNNKTLYYEKGTLTKDKKGEYDFKTSKIDDFMSELAHHINKDYGWGRSSAYIDDLIKNNFKQDKMYEDIYSSEYQTHSITEDAILEYLFGRYDDLGVTFVDIYNLKQEYYRELINMFNYMRAKHFKYLTNTLLRKKSFSEMTKDKEVAIKNLETVKGIVDSQGEHLSKESKLDLFEVLTKKQDLSKDDQDFEKKSSYLIKVLNLRDLAMKDQDSFNKLAENFQDILDNDPDYIFCSLTENLFNLDLLTKIESLRDGPNAQYGARLYRLYIYGKAKAAEGSALGVDIKGDFRTMYKAVDKYRLYLGVFDDFSTSPKKELYSEYNIAEYDELFFEGVGVYLEENKNKFFDYIKNLENKKDFLKSWQYQVLFKMREGVNKHGDFNFKRDFFDDGKSSLHRLL